MSSPSWQYRLQVAIALVLAATCAHLALAWTATGVPVLNPAGDVQIVLALALGPIFGTSLPAGVALAPLPIYLAVLAALLGAAALAWWGVLRLAHRGHPARPAKDKGLMTGKHRRRQNARDGSLPHPFAFLGRKPFHATVEDSFCVVASSGAGKTMRFVVQMVARAAGACVTTSTRLDVFLLTAWIRGRVGRALTFAPEYRSLLPWKWRVHWDIVAGCEKPAVAMERADAIANAMPLSGDSKNSGFFKESAALILRCMMHAAALGMPGSSKKYTFRDVIDWMQNLADSTPYTILREHPNANHRWHGELSTFARGDAVETRNNIQQTVTILLKALAIDEILDAVCPADDVIMLNLEEFIASTDTLYLMSKKKGLAAPVITALVESLQSAAMDAGEQKPLEPVLTIVLDELANVCPLPSAPSLMTDGRGHGIQVAAILQGRRQCEQRFGAEGADTIIRLSSCLLFFGGSRDYDFLRELSNLADKREITRESTTNGPSGTSTSASKQEQDVFTVGFLHSLGDGMAVMFYRNLPAAIVRLPAWWESDDAADYEASQQHTRDALGLAA